MGEVNAEQRPRWKPGQNIWCLAKYGSHLRASEGKLLQPSFDCATYDDQKAMLLSGASESTTTTTADYDDGANNTWDRRFSHQRVPTACKPDSGPIIIMPCKINQSPCGGDGCKVGSGPIVLSLYKTTRSLCNDGGCKPKPGSSKSMRYTR